MHTQIQIQIEDPVRTPRPRRKRPGWLYNHLRYRMDWISWQRFLRYRRRRLRKAKSPSHRRRLRRTSLVFLN